MARKLKSDRVLFTATILLVALSIVMVYSASAVVALERTGRPSYFLMKQMMWAMGIPMFAGRGLRNLLKDAEAAAKPEAATARA